MDEHEFKAGDEVLIAHHDKHNPQIAAQKATVVGAYNGLEDFIVCRITEGENTGLLYAAEPEQLSADESEE